MATSESFTELISSGQFGRAMGGLFLGDERRIGMWILPLFLITALLGATLAGGLAVLYYGQKVRDLEAATSGTRSQLAQVVDEVNMTAENARTSIEQRASQFEERLAQGLPVGGPNDVGVFGVAARFSTGESRVGSGVAVFSGDRETYVVTNYRVVATSDGFALDNVDVFLPTGPVRGRVHNFDAGLDLAVIVLSTGPVAVPTWRPPDAVIARGDAIYLSGVAGRDSGVVLEGAVAAVSGQAVLTNIPVNEFVGGGPLLDAGGAVVAIASVDYAPFGPVRGALSYGVPVRALCLRLLRCTAADVGAEGLGTAGSGDTIPPPGGGEPAPAGNATPAPPPPPPAPTTVPLPTFTEPAPTAPDPNSGPSSATPAPTFTAPLPFGSPTPGAAPGAGGGAGTPAPTPS